MSASLTFYVVLYTMLISCCLANFGDFNAINALVRTPRRGITCIATYGASLVIGTENSVALFNESLGAADEVNTGQYYSSVLVDNDTAYFGLNAQYVVTALSSFGAPTFPVSGISTLIFSTIFKHNGLLYFGTNTSPAYLIKINESNPNTVLDKIDLPYPVISSTVIGNGVYFGCDSTNNTVVTTVDLVTFTSTASYVFYDNPGKSIGGIVYKDTLVYAASATDDILFIDIPTGIPSYTSGGLGGAVTMVTRNDSAYIVNGEGTIVKFSLKYFLFDDVKSLPPGITSGVVIGSYAYFGTSNSTIYKAHIPLDCPDALGGQLPHGANRTVYTTVTACATPCDAYSGYITCNDGHVSGNIDFPYINCRTVPKCCNSTFGFLELGEVREVYEHSIVACGDICVPGNITCENDGLQGNTTWQYSNCTAPIDNCPCLQRSMLHNQTKLFYLNSNGDCIDGCIGGYLTCLNGTIYGNTTYTKEDCSKSSQCPCTNVIGGDLGEGETRVVYSSPKSSCTSTCSAYSTTVTCKNGKPLFNSLGDYTYLNCTECGVEPVSLQNAINATLALPTGTIKMFFPASSNVSVTFGDATPSSVEYRDPSVDPPGDFLGTTFFITFFENSEILHIPPPGTFIEISTNISESPTLFYYSDNKWTQNCKDIEEISEGTYRVELCHATQYAIFNLKFSDTINLTAIVIVVIVLVAVIAVLSAAFVYYRRKVKKIKQNIEMNPIVHHNTIEGVKVGHRLGTGNFGEVYKGEWKGTEVALKKLKNSSEEFIKESEMLSKFSHPNIVQFMGIYVNEQGEQYLVTEFMAKGDLLSLMRREPLKKEDLNSIARQIAAGMVYLSDQNIVHRDLALRNILVAANETIIVKVSDFGLSRAVSTEDNYYTNEGSQLPVKWSAPESLKYGRFSSKSDVWSYGVCIWELFSKGETPYFTMSNAETLDKVVNEGYRLPQPEECSQDMYKLMLWCWKADPEERPSFMEILNTIEKTIFLPKIEVPVVLNESKDEENVYN